MIDPPKIPFINIESIWLPRANSTIAPDVDWAWNVVMIVCILFFLLLMGLMFTFMYKYKRRTDNDETSDVDGNHRLERLWTIVPLILVAWLFFVGFKGFVNASVPPAESYEIQVTAHRWAWSFTYPDGVVSNELVVPAGRPVRMLMSSQDVIHSFYVPEFRVKRDVIPGIYTTVWFEAQEPGDTVLECAEYCGGNGDGSVGTGHSGMLSAVHVLTGGEFDAWLKKKEEEDNTLSPADLGKKLFAERQCNGCHSLEAGKVITGPSFKGLFGRTETMQDGLVLTADENYLRESILQSQAKIVKGFPGVMPIFQGQLSDKQVNALIAFIKEQK